MNIHQEGMLWVLFHHKFIKYNIFKSCDYFISIYKYRYDVKLILNTVYHSSVVFLQHLNVFFFFCNYYWFKLKHYNVLFNTIDLNKKLVVLNSFNYKYFYMLLNLYFQSIPEKIP